jgi:tRNA modification GTPase
LTQIVSARPIRHKIVFLIHQMLDTDQTVCAIASPAGPGLRGVVRISGPRVLDTLLAVVEPAIHAQLRRCRRATAIETQIDLAVPFGSLAVQLLYWPDQRSYTGQPSAELHMVGARPLLDATILRLCESGARLAAPGEFTLRAFLAGRIDLTQAEAVLGVIDADSPVALGAALDQLTGGLSQPLVKLRESMIDLLADVEAGLDFVDEDIQFISDSQLASRLAEMASIVRQTVDRLSGRSRSDDLPTVVLCGAPNAGKSKLLNTLAGLDSAIVSDVAGTTRDPIEIRIETASSALRVIDTAGFNPLLSDAEAGVDDDASRIDFQAQQLGKRMAETADVRLWCSSFESQLGMPPTWFGTHLPVATKSDLADPGQLEDARRDGWVAVSALAKSGIDQLIQCVVDTLRSGEDGMGVATTAARCRETLADVSTGLADAASIAASGGGHELVSAELRLAIDAIGRVTGTVYTDDILDSIFSRFCIGK